MSLDCAARGQHLRQLASSKESHQLANFECLVTFGDGDIRLLIEE